MSPLSTWTTPSYQGLVLCLGVLPVRLALPVSLCEPWVLHSEQLLTPRDP
jgi:hypothetical protein